MHSYQVYYRLVLEVILIALYDHCSHTGDGVLENKLTLTTDDRCICPGDILTYECTVIGSQLGTTVWRGTAFDCTSGEISLLHSAYEEDSAVYGDCNNGLITAKSFHVTNSMCYSSQLNITVNAGMIGKSVECYYDSNTATLHLVGATNITGTNYNIE